MHCIFNKLLCAAHKRLYGIDGIIGDVELIKSINRKLTNQFFGYQFDFYTKTNKYIMNSSILGISIFNESKDFDMINKHKTILSNIDIHT